MSATPGLVSSRVRLRPMALRDEPLYVDLYGDTSVMQHIARPLTPAQARAGFRRDLARQPGPRGFATRWIVAGVDADAGIGLLGLTPDWANDDAEIGIMLMPHAQGRGWARHALSLMAGAAFERGWVDVLWARHRPANRAMQCVLEALAFERGGDVAGEVHWHLRAPRRCAGLGPREAIANRLGTHAADRIP